jgi:hypothetical protein
MQPPEAPINELDLHVLVLSEERPEPCGGEHAEVRRIVLRRLSEEEASPALKPEGVRNRADEHPAAAEDAPDLRQESVGKLKVLEQLAGYDGVEAGVVEGQRLLDVRLHGLDSELCRLRERGCVDVEPDDLVSVEEMAGQRARAARKVEHTLPPADRSLEERNTLDDEDELALSATLPIMLL